MKIEEFANLIKSEVSDMLKKEVKLIKKLGINGIQSYGIRILEPDSIIGVAIYLESYFEMFQDTEDWQKTIDNILTFYHDNEPTESFDLEWFKDFEQVRPKLYYRLINYDANRELLRMVPHTKYLDLAKIYYVDCPIGGTNTGSILIYDKQVGHWGIPENEMKEAAEKNTPRLHPAYITNLNSMLGADDLPGLSPNLPVPMHVLSNREKHNGAAVICYKDVLDDFSQKTGTDLVLLPSSVHEMIQVPLHGDSDMNSFKSMVYEVNHMVLDSSEFLSDNVYIFSRQTKKLMIA